MPEIVLHIGVPKTATTFLQGWLSRNRPLLARHGVWAPPRTMDAHRLAVEAIAAPAVRDRGDVVGIKAYSHAQAVAQVSDAIADSAIETLALSSEYFFEADPKLVKTEIADRFGVPARIVVVLRRQDRLMESAYNQSVKAMGLRQRLTAPKDFKRLDWWQLISRWADVFGLDRIGVVNFDRSKNNKTTLQDFLACVSPALSQLDLSEAEQMAGTGNESLPADLLEFKRLANQFGDFRLQDLLVKMIAEGYQGPAFRMPADLARQVIEAYRESNERVAREVLHTDPPLFPDYGPDEANEGTDLAGRLPVEALAAVVAFYVKETSREISELKEQIAALKRSDGASS